MIRGRPRIWPVVIFFLVALSLEVAPLPDTAAPWRPPWMALAVVYWSIRQPGRYGVGIAWLTGLLLDVLKGAVLGQHALALATAAYITVKLCQRLRVFPIWQQSVAICLIIAVYGFLLYWINGMTGQQPGGLLPLAPIASALLIWPPMRWITDHYVAPAVGN